MKVCHRCGTAWEGELRQPGVKEYCGKCSAYLHCCLNCRFQDRTRPNQCRVPNTETITDRASANFCDEFSFREKSSQTPEKAGAASAQAGALFGEPEVRAPSLNDFFGQEPEQNAATFDDLFK